MDQVRHAAGRGFYRTERPRDGLVVHSLAPLTVLLVVDSEGHGSRRQEDGRVRGVWQNSLPCPKLHVAYSKIVSCVCVRERQGAYHHIRLRGGEKRKQGQ